MSAWSSHSKATLLQQAKQIFRNRSSKEKSRPYYLLQCLLAIATTGQCFTQKMNKSHDMQHGHTWQWAKADGQCKFSYSLYLSIELGALGMKQHNTCTTHRWIEWHKLSLVHLTILKGHTILWDNGNNPLCSQSAAFFQLMDWTWP